LFLNLVLKNGQWRIGLFSVMALSIMSLAFGQISAAGPPAFDIIFTSGLSMTVDGTAGATVPNESGDIYVYAFATSAVENGNTVVYVVASHDFVDHPEQSGEGDLTWHAHKLGLDSNFCINTIDPVPNASLSGSTVSIPDVEVDNVMLSLTAVFTETSQGICPVHVFDM